MWEGRWSGPPRKRRLVVRQDEAGEFKYSLTNLPAKQSWKRLSYVQAQRFWIEHAFHEAKSQLGMAQYQVRVWKGWHHHMALVALATVFMAREQARNFRQPPATELPRHHRTARLLPAPQEPGRERGPRADQQAARG